MTNEIQKTLEGLEKLLKSKEIIVERLKKLAPITMELVEQDIQFISHAIQILQAHEQAEGELGERRKSYSHLPLGIEADGYNEMHDIARPIIVSLLLKIKELENERHNN